jgi:hypothetical protein
MKRNLFTDAITATLIAAAGLAGAAGATGVAAAAPGPAQAIHISPAGRGVMYGDPQKAAQWWAVQSEGDCGLMTVAVVVGELTGNEPSEPNILAVAEHTPSVVHAGRPIYVPAPDAQHPNDSSGTSPKDQVVMLGKFGIHARLTEGTGKDMEQALAEGRGVIAVVNDDVMTGKIAPTAKTEPDHVVVVTGIDTGARVVHLSDTGTDTGRDETIPLDRFAAAWKTSDDTMIVTTETS